MKISSGLPYDMDKMNTIKENGVIVDMSNIHYPSIAQEDNVRVTYIYLRNTDFDDVELDFKNTSYDFKKQFVKFYLMGDIEHNIPEMNETWIKILGAYCNQYFEANSILNGHEISQFIEEEKDLVVQVLTFIYSLPLYPISRLDMEKDEAIVDDIQHVQGKPINDNICGIIKDSYFNILFSADIGITPIFYDDIFTESNNKLFEIITMYTPFTTLLYGMNQPHEWNTFMDGMVETLTEV